MHSDSRMDRTQTSAVVSECRREEAGAGGGAGWYCSTVYSREQQAGWMEILPAPLSTAAGAFLQETETNAA